MHVAVDRVKWVRSCYGLARPKLASGADSLQLRRENSFEHIEE
jgi:hypothetical protein